MNNIAAIVLAAGKGTRIGGKLPKALYPLVGKPMIHYIIETLQKIPISSINVVVGYRAPDVKANIDSHINMVFQKKQLGTAHAVSIALSELHPSIENILVINCDDSSFYEATTLRSFISSHKKSNAPISLITHNIKDPSGLGRIIRNEQGVLEKIVEEKEATTKEKKVSEISTGCFLINVSWAKQALPNISKSTQDEYYLTDLIEIALKSDRKVSTYNLENPGEWMAVNTQSELAKAHIAMVNKLKQMHMHTVVFVDLDNTLIDTTGLISTVPEIMSNRLANSLGVEISLEDISQKFSTVYENTRKSHGYIDIPHVGQELAKEYGLDSPEPFVDVMLTLPFKKHLIPGAKDLLEFLSRWSRVVIFGDGDLVYQPVKFNSLNLNGYYHDIYISEKKSQIIEDLLQIYLPQKTIFIDDQINNLEDIYQYDASATSIHYKSGKYIGQKSAKSSFKPTYSANTLEDTLDILKHKVFKWT